MDNNNYDAPVYTGQQEIITADPALTKKGNTAFILALVAVIMIPVCLALGLLGFLVGLASGIPQIGFLFAIAKVLFELAQVAVLIAAIVLGFISFASAGKAKAAYEAAGIPLPGKVKTAKILGLVAAILGIVGILIMVAVFVIGFVIGLIRGFLGNYYY